MTKLTKADLVQKALTAARESKHIEFKEEFDPASAGEWCEVIKDIVAISNSGGGIIVFGLDDSGKTAKTSLAGLAAIDPADISNRITKYTGPVDLEFEIHELAKYGQKLEAFVIQPATIPIVFQKPGTYDIGGGKQKTAFGQGTVYFRHGAKSETGTTNDLRISLERQVESIRKSWIKGVRKVVTAPAGAEVVTVRAPHRSEAATTVRAVNDPKATPVHLTRDRSKSVGALIHEEISDGIFDEINNVVEANRVLARGQQHFFLGAPIYYRVYAERHHVYQDDADLVVLFRSAVSEFYAPSIFWALTLPAKSIAETVQEVYLHPRSSPAHCLIRLAVLLGPKLCQWLGGRWHSKWKNHPQPPGFIWTFEKMATKMATTDARLIAARLSQTAQVQISPESRIAVADLLNEPQRAATLLSETCMKVFRGESELRSIARALDYIAYGSEIRKRGPEITDAVIAVLGDSEAGDITGTDDEGEP